MNKVILKSAIITLVSLAVAALLVFSLWILCSPQTMATTCEQTGNYSFAVTCADLRYKYTNDINDLARCAEDGILSGKDKYIIDYCEKLTADKEKFDALCAEKDKKLSGIEFDKDIGEINFNYKAYICGHLSAAEYRTGNLQKAIEAANSGQSFNKLVLEINAKQDRAAAQAVLAVLENLDGADENTLGLIAILDKI